jgi:hypothetical protein
MRLIIVKYKIQKRRMSFKDDEEQVKTFDVSSINYFC